MNDPSATLTNLPIEHFLDRLADRCPTPGGGAAASLAGALACAMARMVGAYSINKKTPPQQAQRTRALGAELERADRMLRRLVTEDAAAYAQLAQTQRTAREDHADPAEHEQALAVALTVPLEIAAAASGAAAVMAELLPVTSRSLLSDLGVAAVLADACVRAAAYSVRANAAQLPNERRRREAVEQIATITQNTSRTCRIIESALPETIRPPTPPP